MIVPITQFGKDHWTTFAYAETCVVDQQPLDKRRIRCNDNTHRIHAVNRNPYPGDIGPWEPKDGTRLFGFFDKRDPQLQLPNHDDWDCLNDLEAAGLLEVMSEAIARVVLTEEGHKAAAALRVHKSKGGNFAGFTYATEKKEQV